MKKPENILIQEFQSTCEYYFREQFKSNRFLYYDLLPHQYFGTDYTIAVTRVRFDWKEKPQLDYSVYTGEDHRHGQNECIFQQECSVKYEILMNSLTVEVNI